MREREIADEINKWLDLQEHNLQGQPIFRLTWAENELELREGDYNEFYRDIFVRTVHGIKLTRKYPYFDGCWILEQWFDPSKCQIAEIKDHNGYECIYCFRRTVGDHFEYLPLRLDVVQLIFKAKRTFVSQILQKNNLINAMIEKERRADEFTLDAIDPSSPIESALHFKEGESYAGLDIPNSVPRIKR